MTDHIDTAAERDLWAARFEVATRDDCFELMIPSDLRGIITSGLRLIDALDAKDAEIERMREALREIDHGDGWGWCGALARVALNSEDAP